MVDTIELNNPYKVRWDEIGNKPSGKEFNQINKDGIIENINASTIRGGVITGTKIQTNPSGARVVIGGEGEDANDIMLVDDTTGGTGDVVGNTASIDFARSDDSTQKFVIQKRAGVNAADENVVEMYYDKAANNSAKNWMFIGREGNFKIDGNMALGKFFTDRTQILSNEYITMNVRNSQDSVLDGIALYSSYVAPTYFDTGMSRVDLSYNQADTPADINISGGEVTNGGGGIMFHRATPSTASGKVMALFDLNGFRLFSNDGTQSGYLTVNSSDGKLEWNGTAIS